VGGENPIRANYWGIGAYSRRELLVVWGNPGLEARLQSQQYGSFLVLLYDKIFVETNQKQILVLEMGSHGVEPSII